MKLGETNDLEKRLLKKEKYTESLEQEIDRLKERIKKDPNLFFDNGDKENKKHYI